MRDKILFLFIFPVDIVEVKGRVGVCLLFFIFLKGEFAMWTKENFVSRIKSICESRNVTWDSTYSVDRMIDPFHCGEPCLTRVCADYDGTIWVWSDLKGYFTLEYDLSSQEKSAIYHELWYAFDTANPQQWVGQ